MAEKQVAELFIARTTQTLQAFFAKHNLGDAAPLVAQLDALLVEDPNCPLHEFPPPVGADPHMVLSQAGINVLTESVELIKTMGVRVTLMFRGNVLQRFASFNSMLMGRVCEVYGTSN
jgi:hypothetical protein